MWGVSGSCVQFLSTNYEVEPLFIVVARTVIAAALFCAFMLAGAGRRAQLAALAHDGASLARTVVFGMALLACQLTYIVAIGYSNAGTVTVLQSANAALIMLLACLTARSLPRPREFAGLIAALVATWLIATHGDPTSFALPLPALVWGLSTAVSATVYTLYPRRLFAQWGSVPVTAAGMLVGAAGSLAIAGAFALAGSPVAVPQLDAVGWLVIVVIGVAGTCVAFGLFLYGVSIVGPVVGSLLGAIEPASAMVVSAVVLGTPFAVADWVGFALMVAMIALVADGGGRTARKNEGV